MKNVLILTILSGMLSCKACEIPYKDPVDVGVGDRGETHNGGGGSPSCDLSSEFEEDTNKEDINDIDYSNLTECQVEILIYARNYPEQFGDSCKNIRCPTEQLCYYGSCFYVACDDEGL